MNRSFLFGLFLTMAVFVGCYGSRERNYVDDLVVEAGAPDVTSTSSSSGSDADKPDEPDATADGSVPSTAPADIGGTVVGLIGNGLVLQNNLGDDLEILAGGAFQFKTPIAVGQPYDVTVSTQPSGPTQSCTVANGKGTARGVDVLDVTVTCVTASYSVGGSVIGLLPGKTLELTNNGGNKITVSADGAFTFPNNVPSGASFNVGIVAGTPVGQSCSVSGGTGVIVADKVESVVVNCQSGTFTVGGTVTGLTGALVLTNNGGSDRTVTSNGSFAFAAPVANGSTYAVQVKTQPTYPPVSQTCTVTSGTGTVSGANVTGVTIACATNTYAVGGTITGLSNSSVTLINNGGNPTTRNANGAFTFSTQILSGGSYNISISAQPATQTCLVTNGVGSVLSGAITTIAVTCGAKAPLAENFDGVSSGLPSGWTSVTLSGTPEVWAIDNELGRYKSARNAAFVENRSTVRDSALVSPAFTVTSTTAKLSFNNNYEVDAGGDGGVLEIAIDGGAFQDIVAAGGTFTSGGYNRTLQAGSANPLAGRSAWSDRGVVTTNVNLPASIAGKSVQLRWRFGSDNFDDDKGWWIDDVLVTN